MIGGVNPYAFQQEIISETKYGADLDAKLSELTVKSVMAAPDEFDATFDALAEEYLNIGGQEVIDEKIAVYRKNEGK